MKRAHVLALATWLWALPASAQPEPDQDRPPDDGSRPAGEQSAPAGDEPPSAPTPAGGPPAAPVMGAEAPAAPTAPTDTGDSAIDRAQLSAPTSQWSSWEIQGTLLEDVETVGGFVEPVMEDHRHWTDEDQREVAEFLRRIGYHAALRSKPDPRGGVKVILDLHPITRVRWVEVDISAPSLYDRFHDPVFADTLRRRMTLRPGSPLEFDPAERRKQLRAEEDRLKQYLLNDGFYEAQVEMTANKHGEHTVRLEVDIDLGPAYTVGNITVSGNTALATDEIVDIFDHQWRCLIRICFGGAQRFSRSTLNEDVSRLVTKYQKRGFPGVRVSTDFNPQYSFKPERNEVDFHIEIRERRKIDVVFEGSRYSDNELRERLTLNEEGSYDDFEVEASAEALRRYYQSKGYFEAIVTWERVRFGVFERIIYSIIEGPRLEVARIEMKDNKAISDERLRDEIVTKPFQRVIIGAGGGFATSLQLSQDVRRLERLYHGRGYRDARVYLRVARSRELLENAPAQAAAVAAQLPAESLFIRFDIEEGELHKVEKVVLDFGEADPKLAESAIRAVLAQKSGAAFIGEQVATDSEAIRRLYYRNGFPRAVVDSEFDPGQSSSSLVVTHSIRPNSPARVGEIALRGNFKTQDWVILDELELEQGQPLTIGAAETAQANLRNSGLFSSVQIDYVGLDDPLQEVVNVLVHVEERHDNLFELEVGGGYSTDESLFTEAGVILPNIGGTGTRGEIRGLVGLEEQSIEGKLAFPAWLMRRAFRTSFLLELGAFAKRDIHERFGPLTSLGTSVAASKQFRRGTLEGLLLQLRYDFRQFHREIELVRPAGNSDDIERARVVNRSSSFGPVVALDRRRDYEGRINPLLPARGYRIEARASYGEDFLLGTARFVKLGGAGQYFVPIGKRFLISNGIRYDHGIPLGGDFVLPEIERYFAGGDTTVRGFEQDRLAIEVIEDSLAPGGGVTQFRVVPAGGNIRFIHNLDFQVEVWKLAGLPFASAVFLDTGLITNSLQGVEVTDLRHSIGVALARIIAPFGKFSIEYAMPLDPQLGDDPRGRAHINFGFLF